MPEQPHIAMNPLGRTQRDVIRQDIQIQKLEETTLKSRADPADVKVELRRDSIEKEKEISCLPKCFLLGLALLLLLAGLIVLIVFYKDVGDQNGQRGTIHTDPEVIEDCPDKRVFLGDEIKITCTFINQHATLSGAIEAVYQNRAGSSTTPIPESQGHFTLAQTTSKRTTPLQAVHVDSQPQHGQRTKATSTQPTDFDCIKANSTTVVCTAKDQAACSSRGDVIISFFDNYGDDKKVNFTKRVNIEVTVFDYPKASITQVYGNDTSQFEFMLDCLYERDCASYEIGFFGNGYNLAGSKSCTTTYSDVDGYTVSCSTAVSSQVIYEHGNGTQLYCQLMHGSDIENQYELVLPACNDMNINNKNCSANTTSIYDCDNKLEVIEDCAKECAVMNECFSATVQEIGDPDSVLCGTKCVLQWCRDEDTLKIDTSGAIPFEHLCPDS